MATSTRPQPHPDIGTELVRDWAPEGRPKAYIVLVHGIAEHSGRYERTGSLFAESGYWVRGFDLIGAGGSGGRRWDIDDWTRFHGQIESHIEWARSHGEPVVLMGHSLGGLIALGYLLGDHPQPDLSVLSAPSLDSSTPEALVSASGFLAKLAPTVSLPNQIEGSHLSRDPKVAEAYFADPLVVTKASFRLGAQAFKEMDRLNQELVNLTIPTLVIHGGDDVLVPTACSEPLGELDCVDRKVYDGLRHETLNEPEGPEVLADIVDWLDTKLDLDVGPAAEGP